MKRLFLAMSAAAWCLLGGRGAAAAPVCDGGWCMQNPETPGALGPCANGVWGSSGSDVYAVGSGIRHFDGTSWTTVADAAAGHHLTGVWGSSASSIFVVANDGSAEEGEASFGTVFHYGGGAWVSQIAGTSPGLNAVWGTAGNNVFAVGDAGTVLRYNGVSWSLMLSGTTASLKSVWGASASDVYAVGDNGTVIHYDGVSWSTVEAGCTSMLTGVWGSAGSNIFVSGTDYPSTGTTGNPTEPTGVVLRYDGASWSSTTVSAQPLSGVWGTSGTNVYAVGWGGTILHFGGSSWSPTGTGDGYDVRAVWGASASDVFAVGDAFEHFDGTAWALSGSVRASTVSGVWGSSGSDVFAVGAQGALQYDGATWAPSASPSALWLNGVWGSSGSDVFAAGWECILHFDGSVWSVSYPGPFAGFDGVWGSSGSDVFAVGRAGEIAHYDGAGWSAMVSGTTTDLRGVWGSSASDVYAVGYHDCNPFPGAILHYDGSSWTTVLSGNGFLDFGFLDVWGSSATDVFVVGYNGLIMHYDGSSWTRMASGTTTALMGVWGTSATDVYAVGGDILHYDGTSWTPAGVGLEFSLQRVWGSSTRDVYAVGDGGVILHYSGPGPATLAASDGANASGVDLSWGNVEGETGYRVYRATRGATDYTMVGSVAADVTTHTDALGCGSALYDYRVAAVRAGGEVSAYSPVDGGHSGACVAPSTPLALLGPSGAVTAPPPTFTWNAQPGVGSYQLWVGTGTTTTGSAWYTASTAGCASGTGTCAATLEAPLPTGTRLYFNVRARNAAGTGPWAAAKSFFIGAAPTALTLVAPSGTVGTSTPNYRWNAQPGAESYQLWVGTGTTTALSLWFTATAAGCGSGTGVCSVTPATALAGGAWFFNVRAKNLAGTGPWAAAKGFACVLAPAPTALTLISPSGPAGTSTPAYTWAAQPGVDFYQLWVGTGTSTVLSVWYAADAAGCGGGTGTCTALPGTALAPGAWYFNVRGKNLAGTGPWATAKSFSTP